MRTLFKTKASTLQLWALAFLMLAISAVAGTMPLVSAAAQEVIPLRAVAPYNPNMYLSKPIFLFKEIVEKETDGRVKIDIIGAEEAVPSLQQFDALRNGVVD